MVAWLVTDSLVTAIIYSVPCVHPTSPRSAAPRDNNVYRVSTRLLARSPFYPTKQKKSFMILAVYV